MRGYLTLDSIPSGRKCRPLFIPDDPLWLALFGGALTELQQPYNYEKFGTLTPEQMATACEAVINQWYAEICIECELPDGDAIIRQDANSDFEQLIDGTWQDPQGDYAIPPTPEREEPTAQERRCAAAANAANVLQLLYEDVTDSFSDGIGYAAALFELSLAIGILIAPPLGLAARSFLAIATIIFRELFDLSAFVTADTWTTEFNQKLVCLLYGNTVDTDGVVTFDYDNVIGELFRSADLFDWQGSDLLLAGQITYLLNIIGRQGLDLAGATTAIEDSNCAPCGCEIFPWSIDLDFTVSDYGFTPTVGSYVPGVGFRNNGFQVTWRTRVGITIELPCPTDVTEFAVTFTGTQRQTRIVQVIKNGTLQYEHADGSNTPGVSPFSTTGMATYVTSNTLGLAWLLDDPTQNNFTVTGMHLEGEGQPPIFTP